MAEGHADDDGRRHAGDRVVVPGSRRPLVAAGLTAFTLLLLGGAALRAGGVTPGSSIALTLGALALVVLLLDLPLRTEFDADGLVRVCLLRRGRIRWDAVVAIERQRRRLAGPGTGGLVVRGRRGRWLLATSAELPTVHARLARLVADRAPGVLMTAEPPAVTMDRG